MAGGDGLTWGVSSATVGIGETITVSATYGMAPTTNGLTGAFNGLATAVSKGNGIEITGVAAGTVTVPAGTDVGNFVTTANAFTLTVTGSDDQNFLNERGLTHFWENIDNLKQDKLTAGDNITISANNTISASQPTVGNATLTIQKNGTNVQTFTANATSNKTANITVPTDTGDLTNNAGYLKANDVYPVGSIVTFYDTADHSNFLGLTWVRFAAGKMVVGYNPSDTDFDTIGETGGEKTHTLTVEEIPSHGHYLGQMYDGYRLTVGANQPRGVYADYGQSVPTTETGGGQAHNNMPPYITAALWRRTA
jgi:microcystin-dependent protein